MKSELLYWGGGSLLIIGILSLVILMVKGITSDDKEMPGAKTLWNTAFIGVLWGVILLVIHNRQ